MSDMMKIREVADMLRVDRQTVRRWIKAGKLRAVSMVARSWRIERADLEAFLETSGRTQQGGGQP